MALVLSSIIPYDTMICIHKSNVYHNEIDYNIISFDSYCFIILI